MTSRKPVYHGGYQRDREGCEVIFLEIGLLVADATEHVTRYYFWNFSTRNYLPQY
jgi:hypothetical protein